MEVAQAIRVLATAVALALTTAVVVPVGTTAAHAATEGPWTYSTEYISGNQIITGYDGPGGHVTVPSELGGQPTILDSAGVFRHNEDITRVSLPDTVTRIPMETFQGAPNLKRVDLPSGLTSIGPYAFENSGITSIDLPSGLTSIGQSAFRGTEDLNVDIVIPEGITEIELGAFEGSGITSVTFPSGLTSIGPESFWGTSNLESGIVIPEGVTEIERGAFHSSGITSVTFPSSLTSIGSHAFQMTHGLESAVVLPEGLTHIGGYAFNGSQLTSVNLPSSLSSLGYATFMATPNMRADITFPSGLTQVPNNTFAGSGITSISLPEGLTHIGEYAFHRTAIDSINLPDSLTSIDMHAFWDTPNLAVDVVIPEGVTVIPKGLFYDSAITGVTLHDGVETIEDNAFYGNRLESIDIPASVTDVGHGVGWGAQKKADRTFKGWHTAPQPSGAPGAYAGESVNFDALGGVGGTLYAHWSPLQIVLHGNGDDSSVAGLPASADYGDTVAFGSPTRPHHVFIGWSDVASPGEESPLIGAEDEYVMNGDVELFAQWDVADHLITLHPNGEDVSMVGLPGGSNYGDTITIGAPTRDGFTFLGWSEDAEPGDNAALVGADDAYTVLGDVELFAQWEAVVPDVEDEVGEGALPPSHPEIEQENGPDSETVPPASDETSIAETSSATSHQAELARTGASLTWVMFAAGALVLLLVGGVALVRAMRREAA